MGELDEEVGSFESRRRSIVAWSRSFIEFFLFMGPLGFPAAGNRCSDGKGDTVPRGRYWGRPRKAPLPVSSMKWTDLGDAGIDAERGRMATGGQGD